MAQNTEKFYVGIDAGSVSLNCVVINSKGEITYDHPYQRHLGRVEEGVSALLKHLDSEFGEDNILSVSFTGSHGKTLSERFGAFYEFETISQVLGAVFIRPDVRTIISMGGQDTSLLQINHYVAESSKPDKGWELEYFNTNGPCASGTGSFIDQQAQRLATSMYVKEKAKSKDEIDRILADFIRLGLKSERPANVACRCTVFTKSDMIHLQNKGEKLEDIIHGLTVGNARNYMSTIVSNRVLEDPIIFIGGLSMNELQVKAFREYFPGLIVPPYNTSIGALGVALQVMSLKKENRVDPDMIRDTAKNFPVSAPAAPRLELKNTVFQDTDEVQKTDIRKRIKVYLGIDIGSTTTKYALINEDRAIIHKCYVPTQGKPIEVTQRLLRHLHGDMKTEIEIAGVATTGSGRNVVGDFLNADMIIDEITAHARGAVEIDPDVDTIFEIGGQDSKYIYLANTYPLDFDMNKVCAAGTGSFLHELANKYGINIVGEFQDIALSSLSPVKLAERCTVFMESDLVSFHQKGVALEDLMAGLCYSIVHNYLNRVVEKRKIGQRVMFLGGPSLNKAVVAAFENVLGRGIVVPPHREVLGAYGAAVSVQEKMGRCLQARQGQVEISTAVSVKEKALLGGGRTASAFRGLESAFSDRMGYVAKTCHADPNCHNQCKLKIYDFDGRKSVWGGECGRYDVTKINGPKKENFFALRQEIRKGFLNGVCEELVNEPVMEVDGRPTVGMQSSIYGQQTAVLWAHFFDRLGFRLVMTPPTDADISRVGIETMVSETCYPIKVSHGHVSRLINKTRFLFIPTTINMPTFAPSETGYYCPMVQSNSYMVRTALDIDSSIDSSNVLDPVVHLKYDPDMLALELAEQMTAKLGVTKRAIRKATHYALEKQDQFVQALYRKGRQILEAHNSDEAMIIVTGRPYNLYDERLNLMLGRNLAKIGVAGLPMDFVDISNVDLSDFPSMYWGLGARILKTAKFIMGRENYFGLHLTNFGCGPDSFLEHFYKHVMGEKAYLILELDEHSAVAGMMTRLEAYKNVIENTIHKSRVMNDEAGQRHRLSVAN
ncbi:putative CoA-substrate-specific enzyme activase [uncultured Desulfobacterium sp.]|uniref:Putative CoA-substrate-specific enzyme activase n=1 Tax=uncultured Desulfobacterium sp. TaxID=201089 RepID=A0A445MTU9_9BACT|nr:putative CoA-substrate-specific enzyme activase [uncultured Desulfobacterium sp.]